jgi:hypothetical protein
MIFRTEDDEDPERLFTRVGERNRSKRRKNMPAVSLDGGDVEELEDKPGMFKRVIIRLSKRGSGTTAAWSTFSGIDHCWRSANTEVSAPPMARQDSLLTPKYLPYESSEGWNPGIIPPGEVSSHGPLSYMHKPKFAVSTAQLPHLLFPEPVDEIWSDLSTLGPELFSRHPSKLWVDGDFMVPSQDKQQIDVHQFNSQQQSIPGVNCDNCGWPYQCLRNSRE